MGASSTHRSDTGVTPPLTGVDTLRALLEVERQPLAVAGVAPARFDVQLDGESWVVDPQPHFGMIALEGNPADGGLWSPDDVLERGTRLREYADAHFGFRRERGVSRVDTTTSRRYEPSEGRAFLAGMAALELPRLEATRRGTPVHSAWWTGARTAAIKARVYCESFKVAGRQPFERIRLEDQRRPRSGHRPSLETVADPDWQRQQFRRRWEPMRKAVDGVTAASFPVIAQALADEFRYGYRRWQEVERLAGSLVILTGGGARASELTPANRRTYYRRRAELRDAGYVVVDDFMEPVEVNLADELDQALEEFGQ